MKKQWRLLPIVAASLLSLSAVSGPAQPAKSWVPALAVRAYVVYVKSRGFQPSDLVNYSIGQSHIDAAWRWRVAQTHAKVYKTFSGAVEKMDRWPEFIFAGSQSQFYEWMEHDHPELLARIVEKEKAGRWELVGGMWVEPDCNLPEGESFVRQLLLGQRYYLSRFGHITPVCWVPDSFGYNRNFPQFISRSGGRYLWSQKINWNQETIFPFRNFWWRAPDGSTVLTTLNTAGGFYAFSELGRYKETRYLLQPGVSLAADYTTPPETIRAAFSKDWMNRIGIFYGAGDGGAGPTELEVQIQAALADKGYTKMSSSLTFFQEVEKFGTRLPTWDDELYFEYHQGVQTTHSWIKRANRRAEQLMHALETLRASLWLFGVEYPAAMIQELWKLVLLNQFHDILPGSSIPEVYEDAKKDYQKIESAAASLSAAGMEELARRVKVNPPERNFQGLVVFNPLPWPRDGLIKLPAESGYTYQVKDVGGNFMFTQNLGEGEEQSVVFRALNLPPVGYRTYFVRKVFLGAGMDISGGLVPHNTKLDLRETEQTISMENEFFLVTVDKKSGWITSLRDKASGKEMIQGSANRLLAFHDRPREYRAWNIDPDYLKHPLPLPEAAEVKVTAAGPLFAEVLARRKMKRDGKITTFDQRVRLFLGDPVLYLDLDGDFHLENSLIKLEFNTTVNSEKIAADGPYVVEERSTHPRTPADKARWEMICHKWLDLSDGRAGVALLNNGKYGFSLTPSGAGFRLTVIKGAEYPQPYADAENVVRYPPGKLPYTDQGRQHAEMGLLAHAGGWREARLWQAGFNFNTPLLSVFTTEHDGDLPGEAGFFSLEADHVYLGSIKRAEDDGDLVLRLVEAAGKNEAATLKLGLGFKIISAVETDLLELNPRPLPAGASSLRLELGPWEVRTVKLKIGR